MRCLQHRQRHRRDKLKFSEEFIDTVSEESISRLDDADLRSQALELCLQKLPAKDRELIRERYRPGNTGKDVASNLGRPQNAVYHRSGEFAESSWSASSGASPRDELPLTSVASRSLNHASPLTVQSLFPLLDALCDGSLTADQLAQLEKLVSGGPAGPPAVCRVHAPAWNAGLGRVADRPRHAGVDC